MKKLLSTVVLCCWFAVAVAAVGTTGCGPGGTPAPPEDVADPNFEESEEYLEGERALE